MWAAAIGLVSAILLSLLLETVTRRGLIEQPQLISVLSYAVFWVPFLGAILASRRRRPGHDGIRLRFAPIDALWGVGVGLIARAAASALDMLVYGTPSPPLLTIFPASDTVLSIITMIVAPIVLAPVIEEWFFRGVVLGAIRGNRPTAGSTAVAVAASALIFALMHLLGVTTPAAALATGLSALTLGLGTAVLVALTNRLGGAIIAHAAFNATVIVWSLSASR